MYKQDGNHHVIKGKGRLELIQAHQPTETLESIYNRLENKPYALFNAGLFHLRNGKAASGLIINGKKIREKGIGGEVIYSKDGQVKHISLEDKWMGYINWSDWALESGPLLLPYFRDKGLDYNFVYGKHPRIALGYADGEFVVLATEPRPYGITTPELKHEMAVLGCEWAINLDGGSSVGLLINGKRVTASSRAVDTALALYIEEGEEMPKIAISIGHGENTFDEKGSKGLYYTGDGERKKFEEHDDFNAHVGKMVVEELRNYPIDVLVVQEPFAEDKPLKKRTKEANAWGADLYWSIHANYNSNQHVEGICAWYAKGFDTPKKLAEQFIENVKDAGLPTHGIGIHASDQDPSTWQIRMWELWETSMTAVLTENGFFSNPETRKKMLTHEYRKQIADVHVKTILEHFGMEQKKPEKNDDNFNNLLNDLQALIDKYKTRG